MFILHNHQSHNWNMLPQTYQRQQPEFSQPDSSLVVPVFQKGNTPIVQVVATRGNNGLLFVTIENGRVILPSSALSPRGKGMKHGSTIKC
ncbi:hypothetical protein Tco_0244913 [Tanacetum coccineum]